MSEYNRYRLKQTCLSLLTLTALSAAVATWYSRSGYWLFAVSLAVSIVFVGIEEQGRAEWRYRHIVEYLGISNDTAAATAFAVLKSEIQADAELAWSWHCNVAMAIADESREPESFSVFNYDFCNTAAARFMKNRFDVDVTKSPQWESLFAGWPTQVGYTESGHEYPRGRQHQCGVKDCPADRKVTNGKV